MKQLNILQASIEMCFQISITLICCNRRSRSGGFAFVRQLYVHLACYNQRYVIMTTLTAIRVLPNVDPTT